MHLETEKAKWVPGMGALALGFGNGVNGMAGGKGSGGCGHRRGQVHWCGVCGICRRGKVRIGLGDGGSNGSVRDLSFSSYSSVQSLQRTE